jgi:biotin-(acetyl-CoA carboxylase) ligase
MALMTRSPWREEMDQELTLPPVFSAVRLREVGDAFAHAQTIAAKSGAGTLVHVGRFDLAEFALVLEPEEPLRSARRVFYAGMAALADALAAHATPETAIGIEWPDAIYVNYGLVGGARLAWPKRTGEEDIPPWMVFGAMIRMALTSGVEAGANPSNTALEEEGFGDVSADRLIESFSRHFMVAVDAWQESGFAVVMREYVQRLPREKRLRVDIDESGDLLLHHAGGSSERKSLVQALASPSWIDQKTKLPYA